MLVRTRIAPSPTGDINIGGIATLLKNYALAKKHNGQFILRIEDTDQERLVKGAVENIMQVIKAYGLSWDEGPDRPGQYGPYIQSQRLDIYVKYAQELVNRGQAYYCFCSKDRLEKIRLEQTAHKLPPRYDQHCRQLTPEQTQELIAFGEKFVIRLAVPKAQQVIFEDMLRGKISINSSELDDQVLLKSDGFPTYHLAVVVDDHLMKISHIMRGEEWISSTPKHVLLYQAFGWQVPVFVHLPVFLSPDGKGKMSKRHGAVGAKDFLDQGYLPEAVLNFLMILGWASPLQEEILTLDEYIKFFDPRDLSVKSVAFDFKKLKWMNGVYIRSLSLSELITRPKPHLPADLSIDQVKAILPLVYERMEVLSDFQPLTDFFYQNIKIDQTQLVRKATTLLVEEQLRLTLEDLAKVEADWQPATIETRIRRLQTDHAWKINQYFMMLRQALTGRSATPPLFSTITVLGYQLTLLRLNQAIEAVKSSKIN